MFYKIVGSGKPVIFLHGWGLDYTAFLPISKYLTKYKCIFVSLLDEDEEKTLSSFVVELENLIQKEELKDVTLVGHSFGGRVAMLYASKHDDLKGLVLVDAAGIKPRFSLKKLALHIDYVVRKLLKMDTSNCGSNDYKILSEKMKKTFNNIINNPLDDILSQIKQDTLIIYGKKDRETPMYMAHKLNRGIEKSTLLTLDGDHFAYLKEFDKFTTILKAYLDGIYESS